MTEIVDLSKARERRIHERKEARVRGIRNRFKAARESWEGAEQSADTLKGLFKKKGRGGKKKK